MIEHIIFDLGNVLIDIHPEKTLDELAERTGKSRTELQDFFLSPTHLNFMGGTLSPTEFYREFVNRYDCDISYYHFAAIWKRLIGEPKTGIASLIHRLSGNYTLSVCSNTDPLHWRVAQKNCTFLINFNFFFLSYKLNLLKPETAIYHAMITSLKTVPEKCVFIDDTRENVQSAKSIGIHAIHADTIETMLKELSKIEVL
ncbi:MAG: HAD-IA family hydrolase [Calditrichaeota bacterium]|nr:HAD-IA family hydrolase [Calditrichota bacterium]